MNSSDHERTRPHSAPDVTAKISSYLNPSDELVISRSPDGNVISLFGDDTWDVRVYDAKNKCVYNFRSWSKASSPLKDSIVTELKLIQIARLYLSGSPRKVNSIRLPYLKRLATLAFNNNITLAQLFNDTTNRPTLIASFSALPPRTMNKILSLLRELFKIRARHPSFLTAPPSYELIEVLEKIYDHYPKRKFHEPLQTKLIPSRIYSELIVSLGKTLDDFNDISNQVVAFYTKRSNQKYYAVPKQHRSRSKKLEPWDEAVQKMGLSTAFEELSIYNWKHLLTHIGKVRTAAKYWIHLFSGMRDNEANFLPSNTYTSIESESVSFKILKGYTSKIAAQNHSETFWVTSQIIEKGINAATAIGRIAALNCGWDNTTSSKYPLFPGLVARQHSAGSANRKTWHFEGAPVASNITDSSDTSIITKIPELLITEGDIRELEMFDGFRNWRTDPTLKIGTPWPLTTHQCRRSLAVYGARSGMLSLGSSALQFKQLTDAMASYYRKDSALAINFLDSQDAQNWMDELEQARRVSQFINYEENVINTTASLWGGEGNRIQQNKDRGTPLIITTDRTLTQKKFEQGEMVYKNGPVGGCSNPEPCKKISFTSVLVCLDCQLSILDDEKSLKRIKRALQNMHRSQSFYAHKNPQYLQLESEIAHIYSILDKRGLREKLEDIE